jgi:tagatose-6-phosphate ketose/aldose isomerase
LSRSITGDGPASPGATATIREIMQQPETWHNVVDAIEAQRQILDAFLAPILHHPDLRIMLTGAGTSAFVGSIASPALSRSLGRRVEAVPTTDIVSNPEQCFAEDVPTLLVSFARSGNSPESTAATRLADEILSDVRHLIVTCDNTGQLFLDHLGLDTSMIVLMPEEANDEGFAMTSSFTSMLTSILLILGGANRQAVNSVAATATEIIESRRDAIAGLAAGGFQRVVYLGSGPLAGLAQESALKLLELTAGRVVAFHDSSLGFRHGPKAIINEKTLVIVYVSTDQYTRQYDLDIIGELRAGKMAGAVVALSGAPLPEPDPQSWAFSEAEELDDALLAVGYVIFAQLLALFFSIELGLTPDNPFPDGNVNRVVQGVHIHSLTTTE